MASQSLTTTQALLDEFAKLPPDLAAAPVIVWELAEPNPETQSFVGLQAQPRSVVNPTPSGEVVNEDIVLREWNVVEASPHPVFKDTLVLVLDADYMPLTFAQVTELLEGDQELEVEDEVGSYEVIGVGTLMESPPAVVLRVREAVRWDR